MFDKNMNPNVPEQACDGIPEDRRYRGDELVTADKVDGSDRLRARELARGEEVARTTADHHYNRRAAQGAGRALQADRPKDPSDGVLTACKSIDHALGEQRQILEQLYVALDQAGLLRPSPPSSGTGDYSDAPSQHCVSDLFRDSTRTVRTHNEGLLEILQRLDV